jgi:transposase
VFDQVDAMEDVQVVATDVALAHRYRLLTSMPGVGSVLACTLIALLPELGRLSRKQVAALVGVAPYACDSRAQRGGAKRQPVCRTCPTVLGVKVPCAT